jgi:transcriptional regulator with GAF, ATPase, and Fis domain
MAYEARFSRSLIKGMPTSVAYTAPQPVHRTEVKIDREQSQEGELSLHPSLGISFISQSLIMAEVLEMVYRVAPAPTTVLLLGESGTGKELIAKALHSVSGRSGKLVSINCGAIPEEILESELFGHEKGAFTGASSSRVGKFQYADGGTLFLDEIGEMSSKLQVKLLRVLQERRVEPVGGIRSIEVNVRVIAATHRDLRVEIKEGRFREDLFYRLGVVPILLPPLRDRKEDIVPLAHGLLEKLCKRLGRLGKTLSTTALKALVTYHWPGNVRELENCLERAVLLSRSSSIELSDLSEDVQSNYFTLNPHVPCVSDGNEENNKMRYSSDSNNGDIVNSVCLPTATLQWNLPASGIDFNALVQAYEDSLLFAALERTQGNKMAAAKLLNLNRTTLIEKLKRQGTPQGE